MATFLASKFAEYEAEMKDATSLQDNQKQFNENYISKEKQLALALEKMLPEEVRDQLKGKVTKTTEPPLFFSPPRGGGGLKK